MSKQNVTISLSKDTLRKVKILAARKDSSISGLLSEQIEILVGEDEAYEHARQRAFATMEKGFHLGGKIRATREELHER